MKTYLIGLVFHRAVQGEDTLWVPLSCKGLCVSRTPHPSAGSCIVSTHNEGRDRDQCCYYDNTQLLNNYFQDEPLSHSLDWRTRVNSLRCVCVCVCVCGGGGGGGKGGEKKGTEVIEWS